eukprot:scaffold1638_cov258-Pinguiococcus_pyrenoidosus.AAC.90
MECPTFAFRFSTFATTSIRTPPTREPCVAKRITEYPTRVQKARRCVCEAGTARAKGGFERQKKPAARIRRRRRSNRQRLSARA